MKTKTTLGALIAAAAFATAGLAVAQNEPTSTAGNNCTATGNAMKGGNMSASPSKTACGAQGSANSAAATTTTTSTNNTASTAPADSAASANTAGTTAMGNTTAPSSAQPMRVAKADRN